MIETDLNSANEIYEIVAEGYPVVIAKPNATFEAILRTTSSRLEVASIGRQVQLGTMARRDVQQLVNRPDVVVLVARDEFECHTISAAASHAAAALHGDDHDHHHHHMSPTARFRGLLMLDAKDIGSIFLFALVEGTLGLATPLAVESLVNVVSWGTYLQPLIVLALMLLVCLGLAGVFKLLQTVVVEIIQRRQMVRFVGDLAHRFPRANRNALHGEYPRELANRMFDIMSIQKATAVLLLDGVSIILATVLGMILLAAYHPFLLSFDIVLMLTMISLTWILGRGGVKTAIQESIAKYRVIHWLQDVIDSPGSFRTNGGEPLAIERANRLVADYLEARRGQFRVVIRQVAFAIGLQVIASTALLGLGGWLVIQGQLTLGQLVASELVVTVVVGAFAKAGKSIEKYYDLMGAIDKVGHLLDIPMESKLPTASLVEHPAEMRCENLVLEAGKLHLHVHDTYVTRGAKVALTDSGNGGRSVLAAALAGIVHPAGGSLEVEGNSPAKLDFANNYQLIGYAAGNEVFNATVRENIDLGRITIGRGRVRECLQAVGLWQFISGLEHGLDARLQTGGYPLTDVQVAQLMIARAIAASPKMLVIDGLLDKLSDSQRTHIWQTLAAANAPWTLIIATNREDIASLCEQRIEVEDGQ